MRREPVAPATSARHAEQLPASYWTELTHVRVPGTAERIDLVLVGPSGVHVVIDAPGDPHPTAGLGEAETGLEAAARRAVAAAAAVADLLPLRYRHVVTSEVSLVGLTEASVGVGVAYAASPDVLRRVWRNRPRVVSTSEAAVLVRLLHDRLEPFPPDPTPPVEAWWRRGSRRRVIAGAATAAVVAAAVAAATTVGLPLP